MDWWKVWRWRHPWLLGAWLSVHFRLPCHWYGCSQLLAQGPDEDYCASVKREERQSHCTLSWVTQRLHPNDILCWCHDRERGQNGREADGILSEKEVTLPLQPDGAIHAATHLALQCKEHHAPHLWKTWAWYSMPFHPIWVCPPWEVDLGGVIGTFGTYCVYPPACG